MLKVGLSSLGILMLVGCASHPSKTPEEQVLTRAQARVDGLMTGDFSKAYSFASPSYRATYPMSRYKARYLGADNWTYGEVDSVTCEDRLCDVVVNIKYKSMHTRQELPTLLNEKWILVDDVWWLYLK